MNLKVNREDALILVIDVQERLAPAMQPELMGRLVKNLERLGGAQKVLGLPVLVTEQYPKGLGPSIPAVQAAFEGVEPMAKTDFSACGDGAVRRAIEATGKRTVLVAGMETHVCVYQTVRDLVPDHHVHVLSDAVASRTEENHRIGLGLMEKAGALSSSTEVVLFDMLGCAGTDEFKAISKLVK